MLNSEVEEVTVIEISPEVIKLVGTTLLKLYSKKLIIIQADALTWDPPKGVRYNAVWHDIWPTICADNWESMKRLHRRYGRKCDWQDSWQREWVAHMVRIGY